MRIEYAQAVGAQLSEMAMSKQDWEEATRLYHECEKMELQDLFFPFYKSCGSCKGFLFGPDDNVSRQLGICGCFVAMQMELEHSGQSHAPQPQTALLQTVSNALMAKNELCSSHVSLEPLMKKLCSLSQLHTQSVRRLLHLKHERYRGRQCGRSAKHMYNTSMRTRRREPRGLHGF